MCGFSGLVCSSNITPAQEGLFTDAFSSISYRGPDDSTILKSTRSILGHHRLAIQDLSPFSNQPFIRSTSLPPHISKTILLYNGECYNTSELRNYLVNRGYSFNSNSDTEVLSAGLTYFGPSFLKLASGMYSLVHLTYFVDGKVELILIRDMYGQKPLYYSLSNDSIAFSSDLQSLPVDYSRKRLDNLSLSQYLHHGFVPFPNSIFAGIFSLQPGVLLNVVFDRALVSHEFAPLEPTPYALSSFPDNYQDLFLNCLSECLVSDVPVSLAFSSGFDSLSIACGLKELSRTDISLYTVESFDYRYSETSSASLLASHLGLEHSISQPQELNFFEEVSALATPLADSSYLMSRVLFKSVAKHTSVCLTGDGGDEVHLSYPHSLDYNKFDSKHFLLSLSRLLPFPIPSFGRATYNLRRVLSFYSSVAPNFDFLRRPFFQPSDFFDLTTLQPYDYEIERSWMSAFPNSSDLNGCARHIHFWDMFFRFPNMLAPKSDLASMHSSVESRSPYLSHKFYYGLQSLYDYAELSLSPKGLQRHFVSRHIPDSLLPKRKQGFEFGLSKFLSVMDSESLRFALSQLPFLRTSAIDTLLLMLNERAPCQEMVYSLLVLSSVLSKFCSPR